MLGLFDTAKFDSHFKMFEILCHEFVLTRGDFDERIFLNNQADQQIGTPVKGGANFTPVKGRFGTPKNKQRLIPTPMTPLTNRRFITSPQQMLSPVSQVLGRNY